MSEQETVFEITLNYMNQNQSIAIQAIAQNKLDASVTSAILESLDETQLTISCKIDGRVELISIEWNAPRNSIQEFRTLFSDLYLDALKSPVNDSL